MIQRIQSIYLLLSALVMSIVVFLFPEFTVGDLEVTTAEDGLRTTLTLIAAALAFFNIFGYRNRQRQVVLNRLAIILSFVLFGFMMIEFVGAQNELEAKPGVGLVFPLVNVILLVLANRGIQKDELLVRSADRLR